MIAFAKFVFYLLLFVFFVASGLFTRIITGILSLKTYFNENVFVHLTTEMWVLMVLTVFATVYFIVQSFRS